MACAAVDDDRLPGLRQVSRAASLNSRFASAQVSMTQPTQSSYCLLECASGSSSAKKNSANPRQSRSQLCRVSLARPSSVPGSASKS